MTAYDVVPLGDKALFELILEENSPGAEWFKKHGGQSHLHLGMLGFQLGDVFYTAPADYVNMLRIIGMGQTKYSIDVPVTRVIVSDEEFVLYDEDSRSTVSILRDRFSIEVGGKSPMPQPQKTHTKPPW